MNNYQHSKSFDSLKKTKEQIQGNFTSAQYLNTLDYFIWQALTPILRECPSFFTIYIAKITAQQARRNSKLTSDDKTLLPFKLINLVAAQTFEQRLRYARSMFFNRGILFGLITIFLEITRSYRTMCESPVSEENQILRSTRMYQIESKVGLRPHGNLYAAILEAATWSDRAHEFKSMIIEKYTRLAINQARKTYIDYKGDVKLDDINSVYLITVSRAIDRCDSRRGVLTTFITNWMKGARAKADEMAKEERAAVSYDAMVEAAGDAASDELGYTEADRTTELYQHLSDIAQRIDPKGCVRASLGIPEIVNRRQQARLMLLAAEPQ